MKYKLKDKEITINELLELIEDDKAPKKIKFYDRIFEYEYQLKDYYYESYSLFEDVIRDDLVEIIEEDNKIKQLIYNEEYRFSKSTLKSFTYEDRRLLDSNFKELANKINELIDEVNALKEKNEN